MSEARAITNLIGNGAATLVIARSENAYVAPVTGGSSSVRPS
jgi:aerobic C4-dicarboxylate transport protein